VTNSSQIKTVQKHECKVLSSLFDTIQIIILILDENGKIVSFNRYMEQLSGYSLDEVQGKDWFKTFLLQKDQQKIRSVFDDAISGYQTKGNINPIRIKNGEERLIEWFDQNRFDDKGNIIGIVATGLDVTDKIMTEQNLTIFKRFSEASDQGLCWTDLNGVIEYSNSALAKILGERHEDILLGKSLIRSYFLSNEQERLQNEIFPYVIKNGIWSGELIMKNSLDKQIVTHNSLFLIRHEDLSPLYIAHTINDISLHKEYEQRLEYMAYHDPLTKLANRTLLIQHLQSAMQEEKDKGLYLAVIYFDLDGFKKINDSHGHAVGDQLLITLAKNLKSILYEGDIIARIGGDEFVAVISSLATKENCLPLLEHFLSTIAIPIMVDGLTLQLSASIGVTLYPQTEDIDAEKLIRQSDQAMYHAKLSGKSGYHIFDYEKDKMLRGHHESVERIRQALNNNEFILHYQPKVNMRTGKLVGVEALIRWQHPEKGLLAPKYFIPIIENDILSVELGYWVIDTALSALKNWHSLGLDIVVSVNISAIHLLQTGFVTRLEQLLDGYPEIGKHYLELEILETSAIEDINVVSQIMLDCQKIGVNFSLDDFGTGYSSLSYLKRLPAKTIKIDQTFVRDMLEDPDDLAILEGIIALGTAFKRHCIAEGVETDEHGELLLQMGCELAQGYGISKPIAADKLLDWANQWKPALIWKKTRPVKQKNLPLLYSVVEHSVWIHDIEKSFNKGYDSELLLMQCHFPQWFDNVGKKHYIFFDELNTVESLHQKIRQLGEKVIHRIKKTEKVEADIAELYQLQDKFSLSVKNLLYIIHC